MRNDAVLLMFAIVLGSLALADPVLAGPGGRIAEAVFESFWGRIVLGFLAVLLAPLIIYILIKERAAKKRASADLRFMATHSPHFEILRLKERANDAVHRIHAAWSVADVGEASQWMTNWYWQNQQLVHLDRWQREGLVNICNIKKISELEPILFVHRNDDGEHQGSMVVWQVCVKMQDYLSRHDTGEVVEGSKKFKDVYSSWTFTLEGDQWLVSNIEDSDLAEYVKLSKELPEIEATLTVPQKT